MTRLVKIEGIRTIYPIGKENKKDISEIERMAYFCDDGVESLYALNRELDGLLELSDAYRSPEMQRRARAQYELELLKFNNGELKQEPKFRAREGESFHQSGRAVDLNLNLIANVKYNGMKGLEAFRAIALKHGFYHIRGALERHHFDFPGRYLELRAKNYRRAARAALNETLPILDE